MARPSARGPGPRGLLVAAGGLGRLAMGFLTRGRGSTTASAGGGDSMTASPGTQRFADLSADAIPGPRPRPVIGNALDIDLKHAVEGAINLARQYGPIYRLVVPGGGRRFVVSGADLVEELCDERRFDKLVTGGLSEVRRDPVNTGLFAADTDNPLWLRAHNILLPNFSQQAMRDYHPMMLDVADQLMLKWDRLNSDDDIDVADDMTRLTLDTIALCGFGYRFNSFYRETPHPFVAAMVRTLAESQTRSRGLRIQARLRFRAARQLAADQAFMDQMVSEIIQERKESGNPEGKRDLLSCMLEGVDKQSGERLPDVNIRAQCITFLIAGHETTSGLLSFAIYFLLKHPEVMSRAQAEADSVLGTDVAVLPSYAQVRKLTYIPQILEETLRLWPTAPGFTRYPFEDTVVGGKYPLAKGSAVLVLTPMLHRDRAIWGPDAEEFNPDHFAPGRMAALPPNAYKPFGSGQRACIGRQFAMQEATLILGMLLQRFDLMDHRGYDLKIKETLTIKPDGLRIRVQPRAGRTASGDGLRARALGPDQTAPSASVTAPDAAAVRTGPGGHNTPLLVLFGSNLGTAEGIATRLAREGAERGFAVTVGPLDDHARALPHEGAAIIVTASYNGNPPDNAASFSAWVQDSATPPDACRGLGYTVFGCGHTDWAATYQAIPKLIDTQLEACGAARIYRRGEGNAAADFDGQYADWHAGLWPALAAALSLPQDTVAPTTSGRRLTISLTNRQATNPVVRSFQAQAALVQVNRELQRADGAEPPERSTRHIEIALPAGVSYGTGDHLGVLPRNDAALIQRVMRHFKLDAGMYMVVTAEGGTPTHLPAGEPAPLLGVLACCVELQDVATREDIALMALHTYDPGQRQELQALASAGDGGRAGYRERVLLPHRSLIDLLEAFPQCDLPFEVYLDRLPPLHPRYYSISSSARTSPERCSITVGVLQGAARSGDGLFTGVCSGYLNRNPARSTIFAFVREPSIPFRPPDNPHVPMIMVGCGTGLAPFRGFIAERADLKTSGVPVGESLLFFGFRRRQDYLYEDELRDLQKLGVVRVLAVPSRIPGKPKTYVQDRILEQRADVWRLIEAGAVIFVCGNANTMAPAVRRAFMDVFRKQTGKSQADADAWLAALRAEHRYLEDIWGGSSAPADPVTSQDTAALARPASAVPGEGR